MFPSELWAPQALGRLAEAHPRLNCVLRAGDARQAVDDVSEGVSDVAIADAAEAEGRDDLDSEILATTRLAMFCRPEHPLARRRVFRPNDLLEYPFAGPPLPRALVGRDLLKLVRTAFSVAPGGQLVPRLSVGSFSAMARMVLHSNALGWAPEVPLADDFRHGVFRQLKTDAPAIGATFALFTRRNRTPSPATIEFVELVKAMLPSGAQQ